jgi:hypothetical protein
MADDARPDPADDVPEKRPHLVCLVPPEKADVLLSPLREHFAADPLVTVVVERRVPSDTPRVVDRLGEGQRRAPIAERDAVRALPPELRHEAQHLRFVQRMEPLRRTHEDTDTSDLVDGCLANDPEAVSELWWRVSERVLARLGLRIGEHEAADSTREMLGRILDELPGYRPQRESLSAWLDTVVDRYAEGRPTRS